MIYFKCYVHTVDIKRCVHVSILFYSLIFLVGIIILQEKVKERAHVIKKFIRILECLLELNNFHGIMEIIAGLRLSPIHRLKATWAKVESSKIKVVEDMSALMHTEGSYKAYRSVLHSCQPPCVPYVGVFLQDMTFIEDGNRTFIADDTQVNLSLLRSSLLSANVHKFNSFSPLLYL